MRTPIVEQIFGSNKAPLSVVLENDFTELREEVDRAIAHAETLPRAIKGDADLAAIGTCITDLRALAKKIDGIRMDEGRPILEAQRGINDHFKNLANLLTDASEPLQRAADDHARRKAAEERARAQREAEEARRKAEEERQRAEAARSAEAAAKAEGRAEALEARAERADEAASASAAELVRTRVSGVTASAKTEWSFNITDYQKLIEPFGPLGPFIARAEIEKALRTFVRINKGGARLPGVDFFEDVKSTFRR